MKNNFSITIPISIFITIMAIVYQRSTGPTYPKKITLSIGEQNLSIPFPRSQGGPLGAEIILPLLAPDMQATLHYKRYPSQDSWASTPFQIKNKQLIASLPHQPPAGKMQYYVEVEHEGRKQFLPKPEDPLLLRYKGNVPAWILIPHILFMFFAMFLSSLAGMEALYKTKKTFPLVCITTTCLILGGIVLGPLVQKYAFGVYWAGFPYDYDLTDNKLLIGVIFWIVALLTNWKKFRPQFILLAAIVLLIVYSIPHSMMGSQFNYEKNQLETQR